MSPDADKILKTPLQTIVSGWSDKIFIGILLERLRREGSTFDRLWQYISEDQPLLPSISEEDWRRYRRMAKPVNIAGITAKMVMQELAKHRPDLNDAIVNHPKGKAWLQQQVDEIKKKLTS